MEIILSYLHSGFTQIFSFVILLGVLIFVHELGHFLVARWCGVRVEVFSLGFGKKIFQYQKGDTNYCISLIPLGGYVKMFGEQPGDEIPENEKIHSFSHKKVGQRAAVVLAGPMMNLFFAFLIFMVVAFLGETTKAPIVGEVTPSSIAKQAGLNSGDKIVKFNNHSVANWDEFQDLLDQNIDQTITLDVLQEKNLQEKKLTVKVIGKSNPNVISTKKQIGEISGISPYSFAAVVSVAKESPLLELGLKTGDRISAINDKVVNSFRDLDPILKSIASELSKKNASIGSNLTLSQTLKFSIFRNEIDPKNSKKLDISYENKNADLSLKSLKLESTQLYLDKVMPESPADKAGLQKGDRIVAINDKVLTSWDDILASIKNYSEKDSLKIEILRDSEKKIFNVIPQMTTHMTAHGTEDKRYTIGISPYIMYAPTETVVIYHRTLAEMFNRATDKTWDVSVMTVMSFVKLIQNQISPKNIGGIFSIAQAANETFKIGISAFLQMMALISINLFILNLLPVPVLDGGHLVFYCIEALKGSPLSLNKIELAHKVGIILLFSLMIFALVNDFKRILGFM